MARYSEIIISLGRLKGLTDTECDDLLQEVMFRFFQNSQTFVFDPGIARFRTYFGRIIHGKIIDILRRRPPVNQSMETLPEDSADADDGPDDILNTALLYEWRALILHDAMELLRKEVEPVTYCAFELYMVQEMPVDQVAAQLGISRNQVYIARTRCVRKLKRIIAEINADDPTLELRENGI